MFCLDFYRKLKVLFFFCFFLQITWVWCCCWLPRYMKIIITHAVFVCLFVFLLLFIQIIWVCLILMVIMGWDQSVVEILCEYGISFLIYEMWGLLCFASVAIYYGDINKRHLTLGVRVNSFLCTNSSSQTKS